MVFIICKKEKRHTRQGSSLNETNAIKLFLRNVLLFVRTFWIFVPFMMAVFGVTLIHLLAEAYYENPATIVRLSPRFTTLNPFPSITVCPNEPFIYSKIVKLIENT